MTDQPDQQGDGLPDDITPEMAAAGRKALAVVADRMEEAKLLATSSIDFWQRVGHEPANEIYRAMIATRATRDAAEGVGETRCGFCHDFPPNCWRQDCPKRAAPPQPAPDAMREAQLDALLAARPCVESCIANCIEETAAAPHKRILAQIDATLYAAASPSLGASLCELCGQQMPDSEKMFRYHGHSGPCPSPSKTFYDEGWSARCEGIAFDTEAANAWKEGWRDCAQVTPNERESGRAALSTLRPSAPVPPSSQASLQKAQTTAPVPPADGAMEATPAQHVGSPKGEPAKFVRNGKLETCRCFDCRALSPSPAVAAEPVAWRRIRSDGTVTYWETFVPDSVPLYAAPPVRGEREADDELAEQIHRVAGCHAKSERTKKLIAWYRSKGAFPVQPGAGGGHEHRSSV